jgi:hypothetical protein
MRQKTFDGVRSIVVCQRVEKNIVLLWRTIETEIEQVARRRVVDSVP